ncbi:ubiquinone biosynthesis protein UbiA [Niastella vici]|uniref:Ubiquinone biosynthesis protein UbiA n=1 Tax=Niastella vici TaxID=1703345 RepID=A0A1V9FF24_9BACT|nr:geranylgeranylglycerol-phosphate geranylgeranyltransferase [Niastella vici]OQP56950.1 ubiquinone biosynthesis protein UbiA [Niastella vici]
MKLLAAFLRLIRSVNLLFIAVTQLLFQYCIVNPVLQRAQVPPVLALPVFITLIAASVLIAAAGYIINDYFDLNIDLVNKPSKLVVEKIIKRRWAIIWHLVLSSLGVLCSAYVAWKTRAWWLIPANIGCVGALWFYSTTFKKKLLSGNVIISLLTAWTILVIGFITHYVVFKRPDMYAGVNASKLMRLTFLYAGFAFITSLIREVVKDMEDIAGDARYGCRTMPIVWGINVSKVFTATWLIVLITALIIMLAYILPFKWWWAAAYSAFLIILPLLLLFRKLFKAVSPAHFHTISTWLKLVMLSGILSMLFFKLYA